MNSSQITIEEIRKYLVEKIKDERMPGSTPPYPSYPFSQEAIERIREIVTSEHFKPKLQLAENIAHACIVNIETDKNYRDIFERNRQTNPKAEIKREHIDYIWDNYRIQILSGE